MGVEVNVNVTIRHARTAINMLVGGGLREIEMQYADINSPPCRAACNALIKHIMEELECWSIVDPMTGELVA